MDTHIVFIVRLVQPPSMK